jgi:hypothetical protein
MPSKKPWAMEFMIYRPRIPHTLLNCYTILTEEWVWHTLMITDSMGSLVVSQLYWKQGDSYFWVGLMEWKKHLFHYGYSSLNMAQRFVYRGFMG